MLEFIDISHHQGRVDWSALEDAPRESVAGVIVKAIDGRMPDVDPRFAENWAALTSRRDRFVRGAYAFARPQSDGGGAEDGRAEAEDFARLMLSTDCGTDEDWIAVCDLERGGMDPDDPPQKNIDFLGAWVEVCERELGRTPWIYTGKWAWAQMDWTTEFARCPLWQAHYGGTPPAMPWPRPRPWTAWQYTSEGAAPGISGNVDRNRFEGTFADLRALEQARIIDHMSTGPIFPPCDLAGSGDYDTIVAMVQGLLLAHGQGPSGLVGSSGRPDGKRGPKTREAYAAVTGSSSTVVDWVALLTP